MPKKYKFQVNSRFVNGKVVIYGFDVFDLSGKILLSIRLDELKYLRSFEIDNFIIEAFECDIEIPIFEEKEIKKLVG